MTLILKVSINCSGDNLMKLSKSLEDDVSKCKTMIFPNATYSIQSHFVNMSLVFPHPEAREERLGLSSLTPEGIFVPIALFASLCGMKLKTYSESRIESQDLQIKLNKMLAKSSHFLSSEQNCEPKSLDVGLNIAGVEKYA